MLQTKIMFGPRTVSHQMTLQVYYCLAAQEGECGVNLTSHRPVEAMQVHWEVINGDLAVKHRGGIRGLC
jgi:hypothetical protein